MMPLTLLPAAPEWLMPPASTSITIRRYSRQDSRRLLPMWIRMQTRIYNWKLKKQLTRGGESLYANGNDPFSPPLLTPSDHVFGSLNIYYTKFMLLAGHSSAR